jgi:hypothetical protein
MSRFFLFLAARGSGLVDKRLNPAITGGAVRGEEVEFFSKLI